MHKRVRTASANIVIESKGPAKGNFRNSAWSLLLLDRIRIGGCYNLSRLEIRSKKGGDPLSHRLQISSRLCYSDFLRLSCNLSISSAFTTSTFRFGKRFA